VCLKKAPHSNWKETVSSSIISGGLNVPVGFGSATSSIASQMERTAVSANSRLAIGVLSGGIASGAEAIYDLAVYLLGLL
jgi:hypothetical protein